MIVRVIVLICWLASAGLTGSCLVAAHGESNSTSPADQVVQLQSPLSTVVFATHQPAISAAPDAIVASLTVPLGVPTDLGVGACAVDDDGVWWQVIHPEPLTPGAHRLRFDVANAEVRSERHRGRWSPRQAAMINRIGLFFWSEHHSDHVITVHDITTVATARPTKHQAAPHLQLVAVDGVAQPDGPDQHLLGIGETGQRISLHWRPQPMPAEVYDAREFRLSLIFTRLAGAEPSELASNVVERMDAFYRQPHALIDAGSHEVATPHGADGFEIRWRPRHPGRYQVVAEAVWFDQSDQRMQVHCPLPDLLVTGPYRAPHVVVDPIDPRFFSTQDGTFVWPLGINGRAVNDPRCALYTGTRLTPARGWHAYQSYLERWAANGLNATEIWMSSWNLAFEWRDDWPGFHGIEAYNQANAERLDRILDYAWQLGIRVVLVVNNHGQASTEVDREWHNNPWNAQIESGRPGPLDSALDIFNSERARAGQARLRRYLIARYAEHPAVLSWKLWTEMNLTDAGRVDRSGQKRQVLSQHLRDWHRQALAQWRADDPYQHPTTTHWSGDYRVPSGHIVGLKDLSLVTINAYHQRPPNRPGTLLADLLWEGLHHPRYSLSRYLKPVLVTEFGGHWDAAEEPQLLAEHESAPWAALMTGYAGAPMLWWLEWVDQNNNYGPYPAMARFLHGEDLRSRSGSRAQARELRTSGGDRDLWCRSWSRPGRLLAYLMDRDWGFAGFQPGEAPPVIRGATITVAKQVRSGAISYEWWDLADGSVAESGVLDHPGGELQLGSPPFIKHTALKLWRGER